VIKNKAKIILFDLDDTLLATNEVFVEKTEKFYDYISKKIPDLNKKELKESLEEANNRLYHRHAVHPGRWNLVIEELISIYGETKREHFTNGLSIIREIFASPVKVKTGVHMVLRELSEDGWRLGIVTHALPDWTELKIRSARLERYFERVELVDVNKHKTASAWSAAIRTFGVEPRQVVVVGDSIGSDIIPAYEAGVKELVWVDYGKGWSVNRQGKLPKGVKVITEISQLKTILS